MSAINPDYYKQQCSIECFDAMKVAFAPEEIIGFCKCNAFKYLWRYKNKNNPQQDLAKARWYFDRGIELYKSTYQTEYADDQLLCLERLIDQYSDELHLKEEATTNAAKEETDWRTV